MKVFTPKELAENWGISEEEVMAKIHNTLSQANNEAAGSLPEAFFVRKYPDCYHIIVPDGYKFSARKKTAMAGKR